MVRLSDELHFVGIDIGATSLTVAVTDGQLRVLGSASEPSDVRSGPSAVLDVAAALVDKLRADVGIDSFEGAGVGVPGPVSFPQGPPSAPPLMPGWDRFPVQDVLAKRLCTPVLVDNDVTIMALGERQFGVARGVRDFLFVKIGTGIGCGILLGGSVYRGMSGSAGDIGHIQVDEDGVSCACGNNGCLETYFGGAALARMATDAALAGMSPWLAECLGADGRLTAVDVGTAAAAGDPVAMEMTRAGGRRLGQVLAGLVSFLNPGLVVLGGGVAGLGHVLLAEVRSVVYRQSLPLATGNLPIVLSELGDLAGVVGAAQLVSEAVLRQQSPLPRSDRQAQPLRRATTRQSAQVPQKLQRLRWREVIPPQVISSQELSETPQVIPVSAQRVRTEARIRQMGQEPRDQDDFHTRVV